MKSRITVCACTFYLLVAAVWGNQLLAAEETSAAAGAVLPEDHIYTTINEDGRLEIMDIESMRNRLHRNRQCISKIVKKMQEH